ncbi:CBS domain-containing protein [Mumia qirimensis]|uniref:restriction system modified-DNA reader domain-containing protein n=1 Tax=Mumia qirimensis TaxID=3234852 RepID=UPI00351CCFAB
MDENEPRDAYLLKGRRVLISDLISASLLEPGTGLVFKRPRLGMTYHATVTEDGKLALPDGRAFASPSRAAIVAAGGSLDGWHAWQVAPDGEFLDDLRQRLLDRVAGVARSHESGDGDVPKWQSHYDFLRNARRLAEDGSPIEIRVRDLLSLWGASGRTQAASEQLAADLDNHGLTTEPHFLKIGIDSYVLVVERPTENEEAFVGASEEADPESPENDADVGLTLGNIPSANLGVEAITPQATYEEAITRMLLNDYSQLAVMTGRRSVPDAVTWQSIARERHVHPQGGLAGAVVSATTLSYDTELIDVLRILESEDFVFVKDMTNKVTGIVTTTDVVRAYGQLATPFFLIGELDQLLRRVIADNFTMDEVRSTCAGDSGRNLQTYDELTMGDYEYMLRNGTHWSTLGWPLDRATFIARLSELREIRNDLVHFNPDPLPEHTVTQIRYMIQVLKKYASA